MNFFGKIWLYEDILVLRTDHYTYLTDIEVHLFSWKRDCRIQDVHFLDKMYESMNKAERREFLSQIIEKVEIYEEEQGNGQWLKSIELKLPIIEHDIEISLDNDLHVETITLLSKPDSKRHISVELPIDEKDLTSAESKATYKQIQNYVLEKFGFKVSTLYIASEEKAWFRC